jgi:hypothetical protein
MVAASRERTTRANKMDRPYKGNLSSQVSEELGGSSNVPGPNFEANKANPDLLKQQECKCCGLLGYDRL